MKKKRVLIFLGSIIILGVAFLMSVIIVGGTRERKVQEYKSIVATAACDYASKDNINEVICNEERFAYKCKIYLNQLIESKLISKDLINPRDNKKVEENNVDYVQIGFKKNKLICDYKEG